MKPLDIDFFFSFRSPWSYFAAQRLLCLQRDYALSITLRVVDPIYIRYPDFLEQAHAQWKPYLLTDLLRYSDYLNIPIGLPRPDPIDETLPAKSPKHLVLQLNSLGIAAQAAGRGLEFSQSLSAVVWDGSVDGWNTGDHVAVAAKRAGLELAELQRWLQENSDKWPEMLVKNNAELELYHWGVPTMVYAGEPFFGQDKIDLLLWRLKRKGLQLR